MVVVTLCESDRYKDVSDIAEPRSTQLRVVQNLHPGMERTALPVRYIADNRDLSSIESISVNKYEDLSRSHLKPLLDALEAGDIELAAALTPTGMRLCGFDVIPEQYELYSGSEYGADEWTVQIPPGIYPVFAKKFAFDTDRGQYTNGLANFSGLVCWYEGQVTHHNLRKEEIGSSRVVFSSPYAHKLARSVVHPNEWNTYHETPCKLHFVYPFDARETVYVFNNRAIAMYDIVDTSLPEYIPKGVNPIELRNGGSDLPDQTSQTEEYDYSK